MGQQFGLYYGKWNGNHKSLSTRRVLFGKFPELCYTSYICDFSHYLLRQGPFNMLLLGDEVYEDEINDPRGNELIQKINIIDEYHQSKQGDKSEELQQEYDEVRKEYADIDLELPKDYDARLREDEYLVNHDKKEFLSVKKYAEHSNVLWFSEKEPSYIDPVLALTESGGGVAITLFNGASADSTLQMSGRWESDEIEIVQDVPEQYTEIEFALAQASLRNIYCISRFGFDAFGRIYADSDGHFAECCGINPLYAKLGKPSVAIISFSEKGYGLGALKQEEELQKVEYCPSMAAFLNDMLKVESMDVELAEKLSGVSRRKLAEDAGGRTYLRSSW